MWWITVSLILAGILFMLIEMLLVPGIGIAGLFSLAALGASCWYSFTYLGTSVGWWITVIDIVILVIMLAIILRAKTWKRFELNTEVKSQVNTEVEKVSPGEKGIAKTRLAPIGTGKFDNVTCEVKSYNNAMIDAGTPVEVVEIVDNQVIVKPLI